MSAAADIGESARAATESLQQLCRATLSRPSMTPAEVDVVLGHLVAALAALPQAARQLGDILEQATHHHVLEMDTLTETNHGRRLGGPDRTVPPRRSRRTGARCARPPRRRPQPDRPHRNAWHTNSHHDGVLQRHRRLVGPKSVNRRQQAAEPDPSSRGDDDRFGRCPRRVATVVLHQAAPCPSVLQVAWLTRQAPAAHHGLPWEMRTRTRPRAVGAADSA